LLFGAPGAPAERDLYQFDDSSIAAIADDGSALVFREGGESGAVVSRDWPAYIRKTDGSPAVRLGEGYATSLSRQVVNMPPQIGCEIGHRAVATPAERMIGRASSCFAVIGWCGPREDTRVSCWFSDSVRNIRFACEPRNPGD